MIGMLKDMREPPMLEIPAAEMEQDAITAFEGAFRFLSNFGAGGVTVYGVACPTLEHAFAVSKIDPADPRRTKAEAMDEIRRIAGLPDPGSAKRAGRRVLLRPDWDRVKFTLVRELVRRKFADPVLAEKLLATGTRRLVEGNTWGDRIWGMVLKDGTWRGRNALGLILMDVRDRL